MGTKRKVIKIKTIEKPVKGYEGLYTVDSNGNIWNDKTWTRLFQDKNKYGYNYVKLKGHDGEVKNCRVHRVVAIAFLENPNNYTDVNHKNENKRDNRVENLEWCDRKYNSRYGTARKRLSLHRRNSPKVKRKPVIRLFDYKYFDSMDETKYYGCSPTHVRECCNGTRKTHKGSRWRYATHEEVLKYGKKYNFVKRVERGC